MVNGAPLLRQELLDGDVGPDGRKISIKELKERFGYGELKMTPARREVIAALLQGAGLVTEPALTDSDGKVRTVRIRLADVPPEPVAPDSARAVESPRARPRTWFARHLASRSVGLIALASAVVGLVPVYDWLRPDPVTPMSADVNVAVAPLALPKGATEDERRQVATLGDVMFDGVRASLVADPPGKQLRMEFRGPDALEPVSTSDGDRAVAEAARKHRADVYVYGIVERRGPELRVKPRFWIAPRLVQQATELTGSYSAGEPLSARDLTTNVLVRQRVRSGVVSRAQGIALLIAGLSHYVVTDYDAASKVLQRARDSRGLQGPGGEKVLALFDGNIALKRGRFAAARARYQRALAIDPQYVRARLGLADAGFAEVRGACDRSTPAPALAEALRRFVAIEVTGGPSGRTANARRSFGIGRVRLCQALSTTDSTLRQTALTEADEAFRSVVESRDTGDELLDEAAAESLGSLGLMAWAFPRGGRRPAADEALRLYRRAVSLSRRDDRRALFLRRQAEMYRVLGEPAAAADAAVEARRLEALLSRRRSREDPS